MYSISSNNGNWHKSDTDFVVQPHDHFVSKETMEGLTVTVGYFGPERSFQFIVVDGERALEYVKLYQIIGMTGAACAPPEIVAFMALKGDWAARGGFWAERAQEVKDTVVVVKEDQIKELNFTYPKVVEDRNNAWIDLEDKKDAILHANGLWS